MDPAVGKIVNLIPQIICPSKKRTINPPGQRPDDDSRWHCSVIITYVATPNGNYYLIQLIGWKSFNHIDLNYECGFFCNTLYINYAIKCKATVITLPPWEYCLRLRLRHDWSNPLHLGWYFVINIILTRAKLTNFSETTPANFSTCLNTKLLTKQRDN